MTRYSDTVSYSDDTNACDSCGTLFEGHPGVCDECADEDETPAEIAAQILALTNEVAQILRGAREQLEGGL